MKYEKTVTGTFIERPNRFIAYVNIDGKKETVHVKNTGRCKELLVPGCTVIMEDFRNRSGFENRKTKFDLIAVYKKLEPQSPINDGSGQVLINMDSQAPNKVVYEWLNSLPESAKFDYIKPEYTWGNSRVDFYMEKNGAKYLMEIKGCTLEKDGTGFFPDAPTDRGIKHLHELAKAAQEGINSFIAFVIQIPGVKKVLPNIETHREFGIAMKEAEDAGVKVLFLTCRVKKDELAISDSLIFSE